MMGTKRKRKRIRSDETCPWCGLKYEKFRSSSVPTFDAAYAEVFAQSVEAHANGDYTRNAYNGTALGYMRLMKLAAWKDEHLYWCQTEAEVKAGIRPDIEDEIIPF